MENTIVKKEESNKEEKTTKTTRKPDYKGDGVAVWCNKRDDGSEYLSLKIIGHELIYVNRNR